MVRDKQRNAEQDSQSNGQTHPRGATAFCLLRMCCVSHGLDQAAPRHVAELEAPRGPLVIMCLKGPSEGTTMPDEQDTHPAGDREYRDRGSRVGLIIALIVAIAAVIFVLQNSDETDVEFLFLNTTVPLSVVIVVSMVLGAVLGSFLGYTRRRRRLRDDKALRE
jgi:uncharacterized integral membrane protein